MLDSKSKLKTLNFVFGLCSIILVLFSLFGVAWRGESIVNSIPVFDNSLLAPLQAIFINFCGDNVIAESLYLLFYLNIMYYSLIVVPCSLFLFVRGLFK